MRDFLRRLERLEEQFAPSCKCHQVARTSVLPTWEALTIELPEAEEHVCEHGRLALRPITWLPLGSERW